MNGESDGGPKQWVRDLDNKLDILIQQVTETRTDIKHLVVRVDNICNRLGKSEERISFLESENQKMKGELTMLRYLGIAIATAVVLSCLPAARPLYCYSSGHQ